MQSVRSAGFAFKSTVCCSVFAAGFALTGGVAVGQSQIPGTPAAGVPVAGLSVPGFNLVGTTLNNLGSIGTGGPTLVPSHTLTAQPTTQTVQGAQTYLFNTNSGINSGQLFQNAAPISVANGPRIAQQPAQVFQPPLSISSLAGQTVDPQFIVAQPPYVQAPYVQPQIVQPLVPQPTGVQAFGSVQTNGTLGNHSHSTPFGQIISTQNIPNGTTATAPVTAILGGGGIGGFGGVPSLSSPTGGYYYARGTLGRLSKDIKRRDSSNLADISFTDAQWFLAGRLGRMLNRNIGIEGRLGFSKGAESTMSNGVDHELSLNGFGALFARYQLDLGNGFFPYVNAGLAGTRTTLAAAVPNLEDTQTNVGFGLAGGVEINLPNQMVLGVDAFAYPENVRGIGISMGLNF